MIDLRFALEKCAGWQYNVPQLKAILRDLYPHEQRSINVIIDVLECGIVNRLRAKKQLDKIDMQKYLSEIEVGYGIKEKYARQAIEDWANALDITILESNADTEYNSNSVDYYFEQGDNNYYGIKNYTVGHEKNYQKAAQFYLKAAYLGHKEAPKQIAFMYECGDYFEENRTEALKWYCVAAVRGNDNVLIAIKCLMEFDANDWREEHMVVNSPVVVTMPVQQLSPYDMYRIGTVYHHGFESCNLEKDYTKAAFWWRYAASLDFEPAKWLLKVFEKDIKAAEKSK